MHLSSCSLTSPGRCAPTRCTAPCCGWDLSHLHPSAGVLPGGSATAPSAAAAAARTAPKPASLQQCVMHAITHPCSSTPCRVSVMTIYPTDGTFNPTLDQDLKVPPACPPACLPACLPTHLHTATPLARRRSPANATRRGVVLRRQRAAGPRSSRCAAPTHATPLCCRPTTRLAPLTSHLVRVIDVALLLPARPAAVEPCIAYLAAGRPLAAITVPPLPIHADSVTYGGSPPTYSSTYYVVVNNAWQGANTNWYLRCYWMCGPEPDLRAGNSFLVVSILARWECCRGGWLAGCLPACFAGCRRAATAGWQQAQRKRSGS